MSLESPEEDYFLLLPILACFLLIVPFPFAEEFGDLAYFDTRISERRQQRILAFYKACVQRHLYVRGRDKCYLSKNPSFSSLVQSLGRAFPDCRVVCCLRSPLKAIPSQLSSVIAGAEAFASETGGTGLRDQFLDILQHYYRHLTVSLSGWPGGRRIFVTLEQMKTGGAQTVRGIYRRFGIPLGPSVDAALTAAFREARTYKSRHHYTLEQFGLQSETVYRQYADLFDRFGFAPPTPSDGGSATPTARAASHPGHHDTAAAH